MNLFEQVSNKDPFILAGLIFFILGFLLFLLNLRAALRASASKSWKKSKGVIMKSELMVISGSGDDTSRTFKPGVEYEYFVGEKKYISKRVYFGSNITSSFKKKRSKRIVAVYPKGKEVDVFYNPMNEKLSVLEQGVKFEIISGLVFGLIFIAFSYILIYHPDLLKSLNTK